MTHRQITIVKPVTLPPLSTDQGELVLSHMDFIAQWVLGADVKGMRDENVIEQRIEFEDAFEAFGLEMAAKAWAVVPVVPDRPVRAESYTEADEATWRAEWMALIATHNEAVVKYKLAIAEASVGATLILPEDAFLAAKSACKVALDENMTPQTQMGPQGAVRVTGINPAWHSGLLRMFHNTFMKSKTI